MPLGGGSEPDCGLQEDEAPVSYQDVGLFEQDPDLFCDNVVKTHSQGDVWVTVRDVNTAGDCFGAALVAEGWGHYRDNDNDLCGPFSPGNNANAWGARANGKLTAVDGSLVNFHAHYHIAANENQFIVTSFKVDVH